MCKASPEDQVKDCERRIRNVEQKSKYLNSQINLLLRMNRARLDKEAFLRENPEPDLVEIVAPSTDSKQCELCGLWYPKTKFGPHCGTTDGLQPYHDDCKAEYKRRNRITRKEIRAEMRGMAAPGGR